MYKNALYHGRSYKADWDNIPSCEDFALGGTEGDADEVRYVMERVDYVLPPSSCCGWLSAWVCSVPPGRGPFAGKREGGRSGHVKTLRIGEAWQHAWLMRPSEKGSATSVWLIFGGNGMLATDWTDFCEDLLKSEPHKGTAFLLFDLPGYGANGGEPAPESVLLSNLRGLAEAAYNAFLSVPHMAERFTEQWRLKHPLIKKIPPRTFRLLQLAICAACPHRWDNTAKVPLVVKAGWKLSILHGRTDKMCPIDMGQTLHRIADEAAGSCGFDRVVFTQAQAGHNDLMRLAFADYAVAMGFPKPKPPPKPAKQHHAGNGVQLQQSQQQLQVVDQRVDANVVARQASDVSRKSSDVSRRSSDDVARQASDVSRRSSDDVAVASSAEREIQDDNMRYAPHAEKRHDSLESLSRGGLLPGADLLVRKAD
eukprot:CAMPEP_0169409616 /NCGR_PEP_ID=MMETSP1017-20121227/59341_1 /TAXON_ID=342587 /ORGANISM="Karlodinium micrum, Strain CCMP2283" /LENGTH=423 /DNA_ID=CAMNT_0009516823 /DNA_START=138 /DNA_END=1409 /DNA_ORIENTATION=-